MGDRLASWLMAALLVAGLAGPAAPALAQAQAQDVPLPNFVDQRQRATRPPLPERDRYRFLTSSDFPPFNFIDGRGRLTGFNVDLVRALCEELNILDRCQIEAKPFNELVDALNKGEGEAIVAGLAVTAANRQTLAFTDSYFRFPARFVALKETALAEPMADAVAGKPVAVVAGTAHAAMLRTFFPQAEARAFDTREAALEALKRGEVEAMFGDGVSLSFWLGSDAAANCCAFAGGPYLSDRFLGEGLAIAVKRENADLTRAMDYAMGQIVGKKVFSELLLRYFPISAF